MRAPPGRIRPRTLFPLLLALTLGACEHVTAPEADAAAQTLTRFAETSRWGGRGSDYGDGLAAAIGVLQRLNGAATHIVVERDGRRETFNAVVYDYQFEGTAKVTDESSDYRTLIAWQSPGVHNVMYAQALSRPVPFDPAWVDETAPEAEFWSWHERLGSVRRSFLFTDDKFWRVHLGVATVGPPGPTEQRCAEGLRTEDKLDEDASWLWNSDEHKGSPRAVRCDVVSFQVAFDLALYTHRPEVNPDTLTYQQFDRRTMNPRPIRLVAMPQRVRGVRFRLRCDASTPEALRPRCPEGTDFAPRP